MKREHLITAGLAAVTAAAGMWLATPPTSARAVQEDDPGWSCVRDGDHRCGPSNTEGVTAGCYSDVGVLVASWPCFVVVNPATGEGDVYTP